MISHDILHSQNAKVLIYKTSAYIYNIICTSTLYIILGTLLINVPRACIKLFRRGALKCKFYALVSYSYVPGLLWTVNFAYF